MILNCAIFHKYADKNRVRGYRFFFVGVCQQIKSSYLIASPGSALDKAELSQEALRLLRLNKIPIAQYAAHVLERSQGRGSEILNKPKTFEHLLE